MESRSAPIPADFADFAARVKIRDPRWQGPALLAGMAVFCVVYGAFPNTGGLLDLSDQARRVALWAGAAVFVAAAVAVLAWDLRTRTEAVYRAFTRFCEDGSVARAFLTSLDVGHEDFRPAWVLIDADLPADRAARLHAAFGAWLDAIRAEPETGRAVARWLRSEPGPVPSERLFGPDAAGGLLTGPLARSRWQVVIPAPGPRNRIFPLHDGDISGEPVPTLGSG